MTSTLALIWSGGTDICSLFAGMNTALPVYRGEVQCRELGMAIETFTESGTVCRPGEAGELVCVRPFPCQPAGFWPLRGFPEKRSGHAHDAEMRHQAAYFSKYKNVWCECPCLHLIVSFYAVPSDKREVVLHLTSTISRASSNCTAK